MRELYECNILVLKVDSSMNIQIVNKNEFVDELLVVHQRNYDG
jgi:hypothetical protein